MKQYLLIIPLLLLSACQSLPEQVILQPNYTQNHGISFSRAINLTVTDKRHSKATISVQKGDVNHPINSVNLEKNLAQSLTQAFSRRGAKVSNNAINPAQVIIHQLHTQVTQNMHKHQTQGVVEIELRLSVNGSHFSKRYSARHQSEGPLSYDKAKLEGQMNRSLESIIDRMMLDPEINQLLQG